MSDPSVEAWKKTLGVPPEVAITEVQRRQARSRGRWEHGRFLLFVASFLLGATFLALVGYMGVWMFFWQGGRSLPDIEAHFKHGSIGAELESGMPLRILRVLPKVFPEHFGTAGDWSHFGLILEGQKDGDGRVRYDVYQDGAVVPASLDPRLSRGLPIGFASGWRRGIEVGWFNCAVCHTGVVIPPGGTRPRIVPGMPANTVNLERLFLALFEMAVDKRFTLDAFEAAHAPGDRLRGGERLLWDWVVVPVTRSTLIRRRSELLALLDPRAAGPSKARDAESCRPNPAPRPGCAPSFDIPYQPLSPTRPAQVTRWGPGRIDTFNPYKMMNFGLEADCLAPSERAAASDFPSIFLQGPRGDKGMHLHWDGNNASLRERNLSAALGAGVSEATVDHDSIRRLEAWLRTLKPPPSPYLEGPWRPEPTRVERGRAAYMQACASCHGYHDAERGYVFEGERLGRVEPHAYVATDRGRLDSYTRAMEKYQKDRLFCTEPEHRFRFFKKTDGYANMPLDGLWTRAPYLHNGSVPTLADLLRRPEERPRAFLRGRGRDAAQSELLRLDPDAGGFVSPACLPGSDVSADAAAFCFDTTLPGNGNGGHLYGTDLTDAEKSDLIGYLLTF